MLYLSLGLHGLLMMIPIPSTPEIESSSPKKEPIKVTQLPSPPSPKPSPVVGQPKPSPTVQQNSLPTTRPQVQMPPVVPSTLSNSTGRSLITESPKPSPSIQPNTSVFTPTPSPTPTPTATPIASPTPTPSPTPTNPFTGIPELAGVKPGCNGQQGCWQVEGTNMRSVASDQLELFLKTLGYRLLRNEEIEDDYRSVYQVSNKDRKIEYLHLLSTDDGRTVMLFTDRKDMTREQLIALAKGQIMGQLEKSVRLG